MSNLSGKRHAQKQAFALVRTLEPRLQKAGLSAEAVWDWVKKQHNVESRSELTEKQWVVLSARLLAAHHQSQLFEPFCNAIRQSISTCRVYRNELRTGKRIKVYEGIVTDDITLRCQKHADLSGCDVDLHNADGKDGLRRFKPIEYAFDPNTPPIAPVDKTTPARIFEIHINGNIRQLVEIRFPDTARLREWCHQYVVEHGVDIMVTDQLAHYALMTFKMKKD